MKLFSFDKDGGPESHVWGFFLIEWKRAFSIVLIHFKDGSRDAYHSHAFNAVSWVLKGELFEETLEGEVAQYLPSILPIFTARSRFHKVTSHGDTWAISFRGPWAKYWVEWANGVGTVLTYGRKAV